MSNHKLMQRQIKAREVLQKMSERLQGLFFSDLEAIECAMEALGQPTPFQFEDFDDIADEIDSELIRYATEESESWHHWRVGVIDGLKKAQSMMNAPVYHYLPEVPEYGVLVMGFSEHYPNGIPVIFTEKGWWDVQFAPRSIYAWCEIPPKPPVKEGGFK